MSKAAEAYTEGRQARTSRKSDSSCPYGNTIAPAQSHTYIKSETEWALRHWWLAGWNDKDMELDSVSKKSA